MTDKGFREAGCRLKAAMISYQMGYMGPIPPLGRFRKIQVIVGQRRGLSY
jgi:hypothetical protein